MNFLNFKNFIILVVGTVGSTLSALFGGFDMTLTTLLIFMSVDYIMGLVVAGIFHKSGKSETGCLDSHVCWKGLFKKGITFLIVLVATRLDLVMGTNFIRDGVIIAYIANELLSIVENAGLMGVPIPTAIKKAIESLKEGT